MEIKLNLSNKVIDDFCLENNISREEVEEGIKDWFNYYMDEEFFKEDLKLKIFNF